MQAAMSKYSDDAYKVESSRPAAPVPGPPAHLLPGRTVRRPPPPAASPACCWRLLCCAAVGVANGHDVR